MEAKWMAREDLLKIKSLFEQERRNLLYTQSILNDSFHVQTDDLADLTDLTSSEMDTSMRMRLRNREALYLDKIEKALQRIADGSFGNCEECGEGIGLKRLQARPTTTRCVKCKEDQELHERNHAYGNGSASLGSRGRKVVGLQGS